MTDTDQIQNNGHVVLIAPPFDGHAIPLLDLARHLSVHFHVTYLISASKLNFIKQHGYLVEKENNKVVSTDTGIDFIGLFDHNDADFEVTHSNVNTLVRPIIERMYEPIQQVLFSQPIKSTSISLLSTKSIDQPIDMIIADIFVYSFVRNAKERGITTQMFCPTSFAVIPALMRVVTNGTPKSEWPDLTPSLIEAYSFADGVICNSIEEFEQQAIEDVRQQATLYSKVPVRFVAPLMSETSVNKDTMELTSRVKNWLNTQWELANQTPSVIYIAFGTSASISSAQVLQIADALASYPVIWALKSKFLECLPSSFINNANSLLLDWVPQRLVLSHSAVCLFISHGGWNSLLECISAGKPVLVWPLFGDQITNGKCVEEEFHIGQCMKNASFVDDQRVVLSAEIKGYLQQMFDRQMEYIQNARQMQQKFAHAEQNSSLRYFNEIVRIINDRAAARLDRKTIEL
ncbi:unnamed protein product [Adineta ricciae]|uniref:UDP-glucuronosyltransferase n=1 Tax=Adineta ricciae TaxID=249248 RepID=A0A815K3W0_ADIRI|nr:unnamed protein product [Adineta ricciae]CAF1386067.1 unnamed protein product [Adineta ricciae]